MILMLGLELRQAMARRVSETKATRVQRPRQRVAKGRRPVFMCDPESDKLLAMIMAMTG